MKHVLLIVILCSTPVLAATAVLTAFSSGEVTPRVYGRTDTQSHYRACRRMENMYPKVIGPTTKRSGTYYVASAAGQARVMPFAYSVDQAYVLEFTDGEIRFYVDE